MPKTPSHVPQIIIPVELHCPHCGERHIEEKQGPRGERWDRRAHTTHRCSHCGGHFDVYVSGADDTDLNQATM